MSSSPEPIAVLQSRFATTLPKLTAPARGAQTPDPQLVLLNEPLAAELGLDVERLRSPEGLGLLTGTELPGDAMPVAQAYAGHQFGGFARLGDGRAMLLGELIDTRGNLRDLHLKGSGRTPFARGGDGLAALGPMLREYVISEAMAALGIPTTRSLAVVATGQPVYREQVLPGAVLARVASSHLRVGSFQHARALDDVELLRAIADHAIQRHCPDAVEAPQPYLALFGSVVAAQAELVARWMLVGFVHGVMNTDNMTISGETIDYGPCAFLDAFDPATVFSSIDHQGRYAYANQPGIAQWNLARLAEALLPLIAEDEQVAIGLVTESLGGFAPAFNHALNSGYRAKLGLSHADPEAADALTAPLLNLMAEEKLDHTGFWRALARAADGDREPVRSLVLDRAGLDAWLATWAALGPDAEAMDAVNPVYIPRNHLVQQALDAAEAAGDLEPLHRLLDAVSAPYVERPGFERYTEPDPTTTPFVTYCGT